MTEVILIVAAWSAIQVVLVTVALMLLRARHRSDAIRPQPSARAGTVRPRLSLSGSASPTPSAPRTPAARRAPLLH